jgi:cell division protein ZapA
MTGEDHLIRLKIFGEEYTVKSKAGENYLQEIADYVDKNMREIADNLPSNKSNLRVAMLAAMNITDELFALREEHETLQNQYENRADELTLLLDKALSKHSIEETL